jgi:uncharacterized protein (DUF58 family)
VNAVTSRFARRFPGFTLRPTGPLWIFIVATPVLTLAALNTGNNALYLLVSLAFGAFVASGALSRHTVGHVSVHVLPPAEVSAGSAASVRIEVSNRSRWLPAAGIVARVAGGPHGVLVDTVPPGGTRSVEMTTVFARRGLRPLPQVRLEVRLPLGFFVKSLRITTPGEVLVYPRRFPGAAARLTSLAGEESHYPSQRSRRSGEVDQLREFRPGDDIRDVHWKQTARQQRPIVMERRELLRPRGYVVLDRQLAPIDDPVLLERFEDLVSEVTTTLLDRLRRGELVGLILGSRVHAPAGGSRQVRALLRELALVEPVGPGQDPLPPLAAHAAVYRLAELV